MTVADSGPVPDRLMTKERFARSAGTQMASPGPLSVAATSKRSVWDIFRFLLDKKAQLGNHPTQTGGYIKQQNLAISCYRSFQ